MVFTQGEDGGGRQRTAQTGSQTNIIDASGTASFDLGIGGEQKGASQDRKSVV